MHPSERIRGVRGSYLAGKRIALVVTGSIAAVESVKIARELIRYGAEVYPYMTRHAEKFVGRDALLFATGHMPVVELSGMDEHLYDFDAVVVAPATANVLSRAACGMADDAATTLILANLQRCIFFPAMSEKMYSNPVLRKNIELLRDVATVVMPVNEEGELKLPSRERVAAEVMRVLGPLRGKKILVIGGAGYEPLDNFRIITNLSTGNTAVELAKHAYFMGADVRLLLGLHSAMVPDYLDVGSFTSVESLIDMVDDIVCEEYDAIIVPAALPDFVPVGGKGKIGFGELEKIKWKEAPKFLRVLGEKYGGYLVGFKAEYGVDDSVLVARARDRMKRYRLSMVVANRIEDVGQHRTRVILVTEDDVEEVAGAKKYVARRIMERVADEI